MLNYMTLDIIFGRDSLCHSLLEKEISLNIAKVSLSFSFKIAGKKSAG